jgi:hypothetical protein
MRQRLLNIGINQEAQIRAPRLDIQSLGFELSTRFVEVDFLGAE